MRELRPPVESTTADPAFETTAVGCGRVDELKANQTASTSTGAALPGSTLTSTDASSALLLHPHPQLQSFGTLVVLALALSFVVALFVLPSLLALWARYAPVVSTRRRDRPPWLRVTTERPARRVVLVSVQRSAVCRFTRVNLLVGQVRPLWIHPCSHWPPGAVCRCTPSRSWVSNWDRRRSLGSAY
ncbi:MMPL family transporter [Halobaculum sp. MBLA0147]|uniref:MMPL family transporter n=1 Tax=Halobaculum sp. MBLA0147 TaxID=3079934 RepID=UPI003526B112